MKITYQIINIVLFISLISAQKTTYPPPTSLITVPTAGTLVRGSFSMEMRVQKKGGLTTGLTVGITDRFQFGLSYGAGNLIGDDSLQWYPRPEVNLKYHLLDETGSAPGCAIGLMTQGYGTYTYDHTPMDEHGQPLDPTPVERYDIKAYGAYISASKNWKTPLGNAGLHAGMSKNFLEDKDGDDDSNLFFGLDMEINPELSLLVEYNAALNENDMTAESLALNKGGYLNAAVRWTFVDRLHIELDFNNLLFDEDKVNYFNRELKITYIEYF
ncbi:MAG: hypothetical protein QGH24_00120 [Candidatus Marinimicrobia bacterium]|jgi:hypothetical protein|nr:hypothetical protein [Candidatus Neomarinimicrobiota bacterium]|tara:strand:- start:683 stop:1495 length:813 start_codon:yes stop_codon:yes gene_type:complete